MFTKTVLFAAWLLVFAVQANASEGPRKPTKTTKIHASKKPEKPATVAKDTTEEQGVRSPESILRVIRQHVGGFRYSYEKHVRNHPEVGDKISLKFKIAASGDIVSCVVDKGTGSSDLDMEIVDKARRMRFEQIEKGFVSITYEFVLDRRG